MKCSNDVGSGSKVNFEAVGKSNANYTTDIRNLGSDPMDLATNEELSGDVATNIDKLGSSSGAQCTMGSEQEVHFRTLVNEERVESVDCVLPKAAAAKVRSRFEKITRNDDGVYLFKFASKSGMDQVLEKGPWMIRKSPIILNKWSPSVSLKKGEVTKVPVWVKLYNVSVLGYSEDGLSLIATQIGKHIMLDAFTSSMCVESWGRVSFARALIKISSHSTLKKEVTMAIPEDEGDGHIKEVIRVEYEWKPPHCVDCKIFGHGPNLCPKRVREVIPKAPSMAAKSSTMEENEEGFIEQKKSMGSKGGSNAASPSGSTNKNEKGDGGKSSQFCAKPELNTKVSNAFEVLNVVGEDVCDLRYVVPTGRVIANVSIKVPTG
ncbi:hypothetical protein Tco_1364022, partial [Tanacetum coccineum]